MVPGVYAEKEKAGRGRTREPGRGSYWSMRSERGCDRCSVVSGQLPPLQGTFPKDTAASLAPLRSYLEPSSCCLSRLTWSNADAMLCQPQEAVLRLPMQVRPDRWRPHGASSVFLGGLDILETDLSLWSAGAQLCGSLGS